jgi:hypothetical protein
MNNIKLFSGVCFLCSIFTFLGSILGRAINQTALFIGAGAGGVLGIILSVLIFQRLKIIHRDSLLSTITWGIIFFGTASLFAVTNLNSPVIPLLCVLFVGLGCVIGNTFKISKHQNKQFYFSALGFLLIVPTLYFVTGSLLKYNLGLLHSFTLLDWLEHSPSTAEKFNFISPFIFIGGTILSILLNMPVRFRVKSRNLISFSYVGLSKMNLIIAFISALLLSVLMVYLVLENL